MSLPSRSSFPTSRLRRLRYNEKVRALIRPTDLQPRQLIAPLFVREGQDIQVAIPSMPGQYQWSVDRLVAEATLLHKLGVGGVILFGIPSTKDASGSPSWDDQGVVQQAVNSLKRELPDLLIVTDVCLCEYTDHGHCGLLKEREGRTDVDNDATLELLGRQAVSHAGAGADIVAPSGMMDGMVGAIRKSLDESGYGQLPIMSYAAKYSSAFYGPFRDAAESAPQFGDRRSYQMDPASDPGQAMREIELDLHEGADLVMVKPALAYLDIIRLAREQFPGVPLAAYNVSGEYSMLAAAAQQGWIDQQAAVMESLTAIKRAGADIIITYWAKDVATWIKATP